jgi:hypothetical protein
MIHMYILVNNDFFIYILFFSSTFTQWQCIYFYNSTAKYQDLNKFHPAGFEPGIFCSGGGRDDHYATPRRTMYVSILYQMNTYIRR